MVSHHFFFRHMFRPLDLKDQKSLRQKNSKVPKLPNPEFSKESDLCRRRKLATTVICLSPCNSCGSVGTMLSRLAVKQSRSFVTRTAPKRGGDGVHYVFNTKEKRFSAATSIAVIGGGCLFGTDLLS